MIISFQYIPGRKIRCSTAAEVRGGCSSLDQEDSRCSHSGRLLTSRVKKREEKPEAAKFRPEGQQEKCG
jgi:hypothetical protein